MPEHKALTNENTPWNVWMFSVAGQILSKTGWYLLDPNESGVLLGPTSSKREEHFKQSYAAGTSSEETAVAFVKWFRRYREAAARRAYLDHTTT